MKKITLSIYILCLAIISQAQGPAVTSWLQNTIETGSYNMQGNSTAMDRRKYLHHDIECVSYPVCLPTEEAGLLHASLLSVSTLKTPFSSAAVSTAAFAETERKCFSLLDSPELLSTLCFLFCE